MPDLVIVNEPTYSKFSELVDLIFESETWRINKYDYKVYLHGLSNMWLFLNVEKQSGKIIAGVSLGLAENNGSPLYSIGFYFCHPDFRGHGYGKSLFTKAMEVVGDHNCCLTGVPSMVDFYASRFGFIQMPTYWHVQSKIYTKNIVHPEISTEARDAYHIVDFKEADFEKFHSYDRSVCNIERKTFLSYWIECALVTKVLLNSSGEVVGYGIIREILKNRLALAPLYADNLDAAKLILSSLLHSVENLSSYDLILTTYPEINKDCATLLNSFSSGDVLTYIEQRLQFTKSIIPVPEQKIYGITEGGHSFT